MARYVIGPEVAVRLARDQAAIRDEHQILAPPLPRWRPPRSGWAQDADDHHHHHRLMVREASKGLSS